MQRFKKTVKDFAKAVNGWVVVIMIGTVFLTLLAAQGVYRGYKKVRRMMIGR